MTHRSIPKGSVRNLALSGLALSLLTGCQAQDDVMYREVKLALLDLKNESTDELTLLKKHNAFLDGKIDTIEGKFKKAKESDRSLRADLNYYIQRPLEVKREILEDLATRSDLLAEGRALFREDFTGRLDEAESQFAKHLEEERQKVQDVLDHHHAFLRFVYTEQDSLNDAFASRFDNRPWYESVIGKWEDQDSP